MLFKLLKILVVSIVFCASVATYAQEMTLQELLGIAQVSTCQEKAKLSQSEKLTQIKHLKIAISNAKSTETMMLELAQDAAHTSALSKGIAMAGTTPILATGVFFLGAGSGMLAGSLVEEQATEAIVASGIIVGTASAEGYLGYVNYKNIRSILGNDVDIKTSMKLFSTLVQKAGSCDLSKIHNEIKNLRNKVFDRIGGGWYSVKNLFGGEAKEATAALYALSVIDRLVYQLELIQIERSTP